MSQGLVVGIYPGSEPAELERSLSDAKVDPARIKVVRLASAASDAEASSDFDFVDVATSMESNSLSDDMTKGMGIMGDSGGTGVPMGRSSASLGSFSSRAGSARGYLTGLAIPQDEVDNFNDAIEAGRSVVVYSGAGVDPAATTDSAAVATAFRNAGLRNVRVY
jgi:hypothetical protein